MSAPEYCMGCVMARSDETWRDGCPHSERSYNCNQKWVYVPGSECLYRQIDALTERLEQNENYHCACKLSDPRIEELEAECDHHRLIREDRDRLRSSFILFPLLLDFLGDREALKKALSHYLAEHCSTAEVTDAS